MVTQAELNRATRGSSDRLWRRGFQEWSKRVTIPNVLARRVVVGRFVNSSINHWLCSLHLVGTWFSNSTAIRTWDEDGATEDVALAELADLSRRITHLDPPAYGTAGDHETHFWPATLDRWLY